MKPRSVQMLHGALGKGGVKVMKVKSTLALGDETLAMWVGELALDIRPNLTRESRLTPPSVMCHLWAL